MPKATAIDRLDSILQLIAESESIQVHTALLVDVLSSDPRDAIGAATLEAEPARRVPEP